MKYYQIMQVTAKTKYFCQYHVCIFEVCIFEIFCTCKKYTNQAGTKSIHNRFVHWVMHAIALTAHDKSGTLFQL